MFIVPEGAASGAIETLCRRSRRGDDTAACVDEYLTCLKQRDATYSSNARQELRSCLSCRHERRHGTRASGAQVSEHLLYLPTHAYIDTSRNLILPRIHLIILFEIDPTY